jgi:hypothetical protein
MGSDILQALVAACYVDPILSSPYQTEASYQKFLEKPFAELVVSDFEFIAMLIPEVFETMVDRTKKAQAEGLAPLETSDRSN